MAELWKYKGREAPWVRVRKHLTVYAGAVRYVESFLGKLAIIHRNNDKLDLQTEQKRPEPLPGALIFLRTDPFNEAFHRTKGAPPCNSQYGSDRPKRKISATQILIHNCSNFTSLVRTKRHSSINY